jgi:hypothetical protein
MQNDTFPAGESPRVLVADGQGRLLIEAWDERSFAVEPADMAGAARLEDGALVVRAARGDVSIRVPAATAIAVENHQGDLRIEAIDGTVRLRDIDGSVFVGGAGALVIERDELLRERGWRFLRSHRDVEAREIGTAEIAEVYGSLAILTAQRAAIGNVAGNAAVHNIAGDLKLGSVGGSCEVGDVAGDLALGHVGGNCRLASVAGSLRAGHVGGSAEIRSAGPILAFGHIGGNLVLTDARLAPAFGAEQAGRIAVGGSARIELPEPANLTINAIVGGRLSGEGIVSKTGSMLRLEYGDGGAQLSLFVGGNLDIQGHAPRAVSGLWGEWREFGREFGRQGRAFGRIGRELGREFGKLGRELGREFGGIGRELGRAAVESFSTVGERDAPARPAAHEPPAAQANPAALKEQRIAILRRVADGSITAEQGAALLSQLQRQ